MILTFKPSLDSAMAEDAMPPGRPNIVMILIDDMGYGDIQPFGSTKTQTPALNHSEPERC